MHRDFKPTNVLINKTGEVKLCDFGESRIALDYATTNNVGTIAYWAPERFQKNQKYDEKSEVWSLGLTLAEIALGCHPFKEELTKAKVQANEFGIQYVIARNEPYLIVDKIQKKIGHRSDFCEFLSLCLRGEANERWTLNALQETNWYRKYKCWNERRLFRKITEELKKIEVCYGIC